MNRNEMVEHITTILERIKPELLEAGIHEYPIKVYLKRLPREKTKLSFIKRVYARIDFIIEKLEKVNATRKLLPESRWAHYKMMGYDDLIECVLLREDHKQLVTAWRTLPVYIRKEHEQPIKKETKKIR